MMASQLQIDASLPAWDDISNGEWAALLIGNGASRAISERFAYKSLFDEACKGLLQQQERRIFEELNTTNFESVLYALATATKLADILQQDSDIYRSAYSNIRQALLTVVTKHHVSHSRIGESRLSLIRNVLRSFEFVFSTNYDLIAYWAIMSRSPEDFVDFFFGEPFDPARIWNDLGNRTRIYFLHGALHLFRSLSGETEKRISGSRNLLDSFFPEDGFGNVPLFVSEGTSAEKRNAIARSDYLTFCYTKLLKCRKPLVIYGSSLSENDQHLVDAIDRSPVQTVAISIFPTNSPEAIIRQKAELKLRLSSKQITFFDATTHPLGIANLRVVEESQ